jgi:K+/H+ antiporter YhaU regulatory subunit KhtT
MPTTPPIPVPVLVPPTPQLWLSPAFTVLRHTTSVPIDMSDQSSSSASSMDTDGECMNFEYLSDDEEMEEVEFVSDMDVDDKEMPDAFQASLNDVIVQMSLLTLSLSFSRIISDSQVRASYGSTFIASPCGRFLRKSMRRRAL